MVMVVVLRRSVARNRVERVGAGLRACARLARLDLRANPLSALAPHALDHLARLHTLSVLTHTHTPLPSSSYLYYLYIIHITLCLENFFYFTDPRR